MGLPFLTNLDCRMNFIQPIMTIGKKKSLSTDWFGRLMASCVQMVRKTTISVQTKVVPSCRLTYYKQAPKIKINGQGDQVSG